MGRNVGASQDAVMALRRTGDAVPGPAGDFRQATLGAAGAARSSLGPACRPLYRAAAKAAQPRLPTLPAQQIFNKDPHTPENGIEGYVAITSAVDILSAPAPDAEAKTRPSDYAREGSMKFMASRSIPQDNWLPLC